MNLSSSYLDRLILQQRKQGIPRTNGQLSRLVEYKRRLYSQGMCLQCCKDLAFVREKATVE